jgi:hypothetical protein
MFAKGNTIIGMHKNDNSTKCSVTKSLHGKQNVIFTQLFYIVDKNMGPLKSND